MSKNYRLVVIEKTGNGFIVKPWGMEESTINSDDVKVVVKEHGWVDQLGVIIKDMMGIKE